MSTAGVPSPSNPSGSTPTGAREDASGAITVYPSLFGIPGVPAAGAISEVWTNVTGFTGTPTVASVTTWQCGNMISGVFNVTGLTAASGANTATFTLPLAPYGTTFARANQACGTAAGTNTTAGALVAGTIGNSAAASICTVSMTNNTGGALALNGGIQCLFQYSLV